MTRREFTNKTKRAAWERSGGICEGEGPIVGLPPGIRCARQLSHGVVYDHDDPDANSKDNSLENCRCLCPVCNRWKTDKRDRPLIAKTNHQQDKHRGIKSPNRWANRKLPTRRDKQRVLAKIAAREEARR